MKNSKFLHVFLCLFFLTSVSPVRSNIQINHKKSAMDLVEKKIQIKKFVLFDAMNYVDKPADLTSEGLLPIKVIYENFLTSPNPDDSSKVILDLGKIKTQAYNTLHLNPKYICTDVEQWFYDASVNSKEMSNRFNKMFKVFRDKINDVKISNYGIAPSALCVYRFYDNNQTDNETLINNWRKSNEKRWDSVKNVDFLTPCVYIAEPNIDSWIKDLELTVKEIKKHDSYKKIIVFIWPQYYDKPNSPYFKQFIDPKIWAKMLTAVYAYCDGAIIWSSTTDENKQTVKWNDSRVQTMMDATKQFINFHKNSIKVPNSFEKN